MNLIGLEIEVKGKRKFIGKAGICPKGVPGYAGKRILYREVRYSDFYSYTTRTLGIDAEVWRAARREFQVLALLTYCTDTGELWAIDGPVLDAAPVADLGERPQLRVAPKDAKKRQCDKLNMGYTRLVRLVAPAITSNQAA
jgi:hypothetical protein